MREGVREGGVQYFHSGVKVKAPRMLRRSHSVINLFDIRIMLILTV